MLSVRNLSASFHTGRVFCLYMRFPHICIKRTIFQKFFMSSSCGDFSVFYYCNLLRLDNSR